MIFRRRPWHDDCERRGRYCLTEEIPVGRIRLAALVLPLAVACLPAGAEAQWRPIYPGYPSYRYALPESDLRINVKPKEAAVYVDGYFAGTVDEFDGSFERLHVAPGEHEIVVYLAGYRSMRQKLYLSSNRSRKIDGTLERLGAGEPNEPLPTPVDLPDGPDGYRPLPPRDPSPRADAPDPRDRGPRDRAPRDQDPRDRNPGDRDPRDRDTPPPPSGNRLGTLVIRVQAGGATVLIDGERWQGPADNDERLIVQVPEGRHTVEVQREGFERFVTDIDVRRGQTAAVNISLTRSR